MNNINTEHPNWKNHLVDLIQEKWDKRDRKSLQQRWIISAKALKKIEKEEYPMIVRELITPYLEEHTDKIKNFSLTEHYGDDMSLIIDMKVEPIDEIAKYIY